MTTWLRFLGQWRYALLVGAAVLAAMAAMVFTAWRAVVCAQVFAPFVLFDTSIEDSTIERGPDERSARALRFVRGAAVVGVVIYVAYVLTLVIPPAMTVLRFVLGDQPGRLRPHGGPGVAD